MTKLDQDDLADLKILTETPFQSSESVDTGHYKQTEHRFIRFVDMFLVCGLSQKEEQQIAELTRHALFMNSSSRHQSLNYVCL